MKSIYLKEHIKDCRLSASLELMKSFILFNMTEAQLIPFAAIFIRLADRTLYHSSNVWSKFISDLNIPAEVLNKFPDDAFIHTNDVSSKYEIEAYFAAAKALFEKNLIGINEHNKQNLLGRSFASHPEDMQRIKNLFSMHRAKFFQVANELRNHAFHVNSQLKDYGFVALVKKANGKYVVTLPNIFKDTRGNDVDLAEAFASTHKSIILMLHEVRDTLLEFFFREDARPANRSFQGIRSPHARGMVGLGPNGFEFCNVQLTENSRIM